MRRGPSRRPQPLARVHYGVGVCLSFCGWPSGAVSAFADASTADPGWADPHVRRGDALGRAGRWDDAASAYAEGARLAPSNPDVQGLLALALSRDRRWTECAAALQRLVKLRPEQAEVHLALGAAQQRAGQAQEAIRSFRWAARLPVPPQSRRFTLGEALLGREAWGEVLARWNGARRIAPVAGVVTALLGAPFLAGVARAAAPADARACWSTAASQGLEACRRAMGLRLTDAQAAAVEQAYAGKLAAAGRMGEMVDVYRTGVARRPRDADAHRRLGAALLQAVARPAEAEPVLREAVRLDPASAHAHGLLALALAGLGRGADAAAACTAATDRDPRYLEKRPGTRAACDAARAGRRWPEGPGS